MRRLMITVDVEAQPARAEGDHVARLIWGEHPAGRAGIGEMMDVAERHGVALTMFLDYCEEPLYGESLLDAGRQIHRRGHDLQLHAHLDFLADDFWRSRGIKPERSLNEVDSLQAAAVFDFLTERHHLVTGQRPVAFRGGGYRFNDCVLDAMAARGIVLDSSVNVSRATQPVPLPLSGQFAWSNGCIEIPVSCVTGYRNLTRAFDFNFNAGALAGSAAMLDYLDVFHRERGEGAVAVLVLHSWSFLGLENGGHFGGPVEAAVRRLDDFLGAIAGRIRVVSARELVAEHRAGELPLDRTLDVALVGVAARRAAARAPATETAPSAVAAGTPVVSVSTAGMSTCPICGAAKERFTEMEGRRCPDCGSLERQRSFAAAYDGAIRAELDVAGQPLLMFSPAACELRFLKARGAGGIRRADIRPETRPDIVVDVCRMPQIGTETEQLVFASYLMPLVYDLDAALDEIARVLRPDGTFLSIEPVRSGRPTVETTDEAALTRYYGREAYEKYRLGSFRTLGEADYLAALEKRFAVRRFGAADPITGQVTLVHVCTRHGDAGQSAAMPAARHESPPVAASGAKPAEVAASTGPADTARPFDAADRGYTQYKAANPAGSYAKFSVGNQIAFIRRGGIHPTLGRRVQNYDEWWKAGESDFRSYLRRFGIREQDRLVDYGCGSLRVGGHFIRYLQPGHYFGLDVTMDFIELGIAEIGEELIREKVPRFGPLEEGAIAEAADFAPDWVISTSCVFQIHPEDKPDFFRNIKRIAHRPGCTVCFDTKIAAEHFRYRDTAWVWPLAHYVENLAPLELVADQLVREHHEVGRTFEARVLVFRHP